MREGDIRICTLVSHNGSFAQDGINSCSDEAINEAHARLYKVIGYPDFHDYFRAGIWDEALISRYIADGIDAEMASKL